MICSLNYSANLTTYPQSQAATAHVQKAAIVATDVFRYFVQQYVDLATRVQGCQPKSALNAPGIDQD